MLTRSFTRREKCMLLVLALVLVAGLYYLVVYQPLHEELDQIAFSQRQVEDDLMIAQIQQSQLTAMQAELEEILSQPADKLTEVPVYDNLQNVMNRLNLILAASTGYSLNFEPVEIDGASVRRTIEMTFTSASYADARAILEQLSATGYRTLISAFSLQADSDQRNAAPDLASYPVSATVTITFFERTGS